MIRTEAKYAKALTQIAQLEASRDTGASDGGDRGDGVASQEVNHADSSDLLAHLLNETEVFRRMQRGDLETLNDISNIGQWLITLRISRGLNNVEFGKLIGISQQQVYNDENKLYHGISIERAHLLLEKLGIKYQMQPYSEIEAENFPLDDAVISDHQIESVPLDICEQLAVLLRADKNLTLDQVMHLSYTFDRLYKSYVRSSMIDHTEMEQ